MTTMTTAPDGQTTTTRREQAIAAAEDYFTAKKVIDALNEKAKPAKEQQKIALDTLAGLYPAERTHADALHPVTVFGNATATFMHREDTSVAWKKVAEGLLHHLTPEQRQEYDRLLAFHTGPKVTKSLKK